MLLGGWEKYTVFQKNVVPNFYDNVRCDYCKSSAPRLFETQCTSALHYYTGCLPMNFINDQQMLLVYEYSTLLLLRYAWKTVARIKQEVQLPQR